MSSGFLAAKKLMPNLGVGLGLRRELAAETFENADQIDFLELVPENYMDLGGRIRERLDIALEKFPLVTHGVNLSIGSTDPLSQDYLASISRLLNKINAPWWSDHLCFASIANSYLHDLIASAALA
jgi:uncharacterized protein (UPF0276 family)